MVKMQIRIEQQDFKAALKAQGRRNSMSCVVAQAILRANPAIKSLKVDLATIRLSDPQSRKRYIYFTPAEAQRSIINFDQGKDFQPAEFRAKLAQVLPIQAVKADGSRVNR